MPLGILYSFSSFQDKFFLFFSLFSSTNIPYKMLKRRRFRVILWVQWSETKNEMVRSEGIIHHDIDCARQQSMKKKEVELSWSNNSVQRRFVSNNAIQPAHYYDLNISLLLKTEIVWVSILCTHSKNRNLSEYVLCNSTAADDDQGLFFHLKCMTIKYVQFSIVYINAEIISI